MGFHIFPVTGIVREQKPQSFYTDVMDGVSSLVEMVSDRLVSVLFYVSQVFLEAGVEGASRFADAEFGALGAMNNVHDVVRLAVELFGDVHLGFRSLDADVGADKGARFAFLLVARSGSWCSGGWLPHDRTNMPRMLVSRLYAISGGRLKILATSVRACRRLQFDRMILRTRIIEGW